MKKYKVVIVGGGSTWTPGLLKSLCEKKNEFPILTEKTARLPECCQSIPVPFRFINA